jgi:biopolymer transport protein TolR
MRCPGDQPMSEINITPLTDVMLVLLIIFMISSPVLLARGMDIHLPKVKDPQMLKQEDHVLYIKSDGNMNLDKKDYPAEELPTALKVLVDQADIEGKAVTLFIRADENVTYGLITSVMDTATTSGIESISLVQEMMEPPSTPTIEAPQPDGSQPEIAPSGEEAAQG